MNDATLAHLVYQYDLPRSLVAAMDRYEERVILWHEAPVKDAEKLKAADDALRLTRISLAGLIVEYGDACVASDRACGPTAHAARWLLSIGAAVRRLAKE